MEMDLRFKYDYRPLGLLVTIARLCFMSVNRKRKSLIALSSSKTAQLFNAMRLKGDLELSLGTVEKRSKGNVTAFQGRIYLSKE